MTDNRPTMEERRLAKAAAHRARLGLPPKTAPLTSAQLRARLRAAEGFDLGAVRRKRHEDTRTANRIDGYDRDDLGLSPDY